MYISQKWFQSQWLYIEIVWIFHVWAIYFPAGKWIFHWRSVTCPPAASACGDFFPPPFFTFSSHSGDESHRRTTADFPGYSGSGLTAGGVRRLRPRLKAMQGGQGSSIDGRAGQGGGARRCKSFTDGLRLQGQHQSIGRLPFRFPLFRSLSSKIGEEFPISFYIFLEKKKINFKIFVLFAVGKSIRIFGKIW